MCAVHEAVEDAVGDGRIGDHFMPVLDVDLAGHDRRAASLPVVEDLQEIAALIRRQMAEAPVGDDEQLRAGDALRDARGGRRRVRAPRHRTTVTRDSRGPSDRRGTPCAPARMRANFC